MLHAQLHGNWSTGSGESFEGFLPYKAWWPYWSSEQNTANKLSFPLPTEAPHKFGFDWPSGLGEEDV